MDVYDRIELRAKALGISKAHISTTMGMTRTWLNSAQSYQTFKKHALEKMYGSDPENE